MNIVIRRAVESDLPPMVEMLHELLSLEVDFEPDRRKQMRALRMILENPGCLLLAAEHEHCGHVQCPNADFHGGGRSFGNDRRYRRKP